MIDTHHDSPAVPTAGPETVASAGFSAIGTTVTVLCTVADELDEAAALMRRRLAELDRAASRFRTDSELAQINTASAERARTDPDGSVCLPVGEVLARCLGAAVHAERLTDGLVCASLGAELAACGYDDDIDIVRARTDTGSRPTPEHTARQAVSRRTDFDEQRARVTLPAGTALDLGAVAKAWAADAIAEELARSGSGGYLVNLGGDTAVSGVVPDDGWAIGVLGPDGAQVQVVRSDGQAFATSSTRLRTWRQHGRHRHHIIDPRTGMPAHTRWAQATCAAPTAVQANAASTAAVILDDRAPDWLTARRVPACLIAADHQITTAPGWPGITTPAVGVS
ncbi:FAD:protein FMN transferase [Gordonia sp. VNQ95]|jgi:thiamine biosynthesis lipoprotein|uniref:FAD:protein FMN transferase n=1 Tax=Gordonia TaxID=2053 RepID=UPI0032B35DE7